MTVTIYKFKCLNPKCRRDFETTQYFAHYCSAACRQRDYNRRRAERTNAEKQQLKDKAKAG